MSKTKATDSGLKRKREVDDSSNRPVSKKQSQSASTRERASPRGVDASLALSDPQLLADHFAKTIRRQFKSSTSVELEDKYLPASAFRDTTSFPKERTIDELANFLVETVGDKATRKIAEHNSQPHTLVVCSSGIRAADVARALRPFRTQQNAIAKLFAKHLKLKDTISYVKKTTFGFGVGTPARLNDLLDAEALDVSRLERIVIDGSYQDEKRRTIFSMRELFLPTLELLHRDSIRARLGAQGGCQIMVF